MSCPYLRPSGCLGWMQDPDHVRRMARLPGVPSRESRPTSWGPRTVSLVLRISPVQQPRPVSICPHPAQENPQWLLSLSHPDQGRSSLKVTQIPGISRPGTASMSDLGRDNHCSDGQTEAWKDSICQGRGVKATPGRSVTHSYLYSRGVASNALLLAQRRRLPYETPQSTGPQTRDQEWQICLWLHLLSLQTWSVPSWVIILATSPGPAANCYKAHGRASWAMGTRRSVE